MRLYLSKEEGIALSMLLMNELMSIASLPDEQFSELSTKDYTNMCMALNERIEDCLIKQKSGYNRKDK